jgi:sarcosine oxidase
MAHACDAIVIGLGGMGAAALDALARRGCRVIGLDRHDVPNEIGASYGHETRIYRFSYFEDQRYVPLMRRAHELWLELEQGQPDQIVHPVGCLEIGPPEGKLVSGALAAARLHDLPHEVLSAIELRRRYPAWSIPDDFVALYEEQAGFLRADRGVSALLARALRAGADIRAREPVRRWSSTGSRVLVETTRGAYEAQHLVIAAGAWTRELVPDLAHVLVPERQVVAWFAPLSQPLFEARQFAAFGLDAPEGLFYGLPMHSRPGFKFARYNHRQEQGDAAFRRNIDDEDLAALAGAVRRYLPQGAGPVLSAMTCLFTNSPDGHFVLGHLPSQENVILAGGCSGHAYKFMPAIGECIADLVLAGRTRHDIGLFDPGRLG